MPRYFLLGNLLGIPRGIWLALALAAACGGVAYWLDARQDAAREQGAAQQREADLRETLERTENANKARDDVRSNDAARHAQCLRTARTPANCERFMPGVQADQR